MSLPQREFLSNIDDQVGLIIWLSESALTINTHGFKECDYLCDGLVSEFLKLSPAAIEQNVFHTNHYGKKLFIAFYKNTKSVLSSLDDVIGLLTESKESFAKKIVLLDNHNPGELMGELAKRYPAFDFKHYTF